MSVYQYKSTYLILSLQKTPQPAHYNWALWNQHFTNSHSCRGWRSFYKLDFSNLLPPFACKVPVIFGHNAKQSKFEYPMLSFETIFIRFQFPLQRLYAALLLWVWPQIWWFLSETWSGFFGPSWSFVSKNMFTVSLTSYVFHHSRSCIPKFVGLIIID